ncbi:N-(5'-phosphoribosyl)anthranilate isomerase [Streptomyces sp. NPDC050145]|uniref:phosphoribosylanthranilate isomerase n=1 Tax=Streptomyces sp. NPDC050145 TaxID=3365602 RepID=UPI0037AD29CF
MLVKVCGATTEEEVRAVAGAGADLVGLWCGVPGGPHDLAADEVARLAGAARRTGAVEPVLVTFGKDAGRLLSVVAEAGLSWVQLHGFQPPSLVRRLRREGPPGLRIVKVLHLDPAGRCLQGPLVAAYERAGADLLLFDTAAADGRIGSTGLSADPAAVLALAARATLPFLLAGGIGAHNREDFETVLDHPRLLGIDVDSAARGPLGTLDAGTAGAVVRAWRGERGARGEAAA